MIDSKEFRAHNIGSDVWNLPETHWVEVVKVTFFKINYYKIYQIFR